MTLSLTKSNTYFYTSLKHASDLNCWANVGPQWASDIISGQPLANIAPINLPVKFVAYIQHSSVERKP